MNLKNEKGSKQKDQVDLVAWYLKNLRELPWRKTKNPYAIWLSEVMLQQTTVQAVIPYYEKFLKAFPDVDSLAEAPLEKVYELWSGLGYYSRARSLHKTAQALAGKKFPQTYEELIQLPGLGPYTARAVASIAFEQKVGVVDGNVIRVLSRMYGIDEEWWKNKFRDRFQNIADELANHAQPSIVNQALMELGATLCTPKKVLCLLCPWSSRCIAKAEDRIESLPRPKPRKAMELWTYTPEIVLKEIKGKLHVGLYTDHELPFLKKGLMFPGPGARVQTKPKDYLVHHTITHHSIFILRPQVLQTREPQVLQTPEPQVLQKPAVSEGLTWISVDELSQKAPSILLKKVLAKSRALET